MIHHLLEECIHDRPLHKIVLQCLSSWNTVQFQQHSGILHPYNIYSIYLVVKASQFVFHIVAMQVYLRWIVILQQNFCLDFTENNWLSHHHIRLPWSIVKGFTFFTRFCDCSVKIELICRNNFAKNSLNCFLVCSKVNRQFPCPSLLRFHLDNGVVTRKIGHPLSANSTSIFSSMMSQNFCGLFSTTENHFFSERGPTKWPLSYTKLVRKYGDDFSICQTFFSMVFLVRGNVVEHRHK